MTVLRSSTAAIAASVTLAIASGHAAEDRRSQDLGPWEIETIYKGDKLDHCSINRSLQDDIVARFVRTTDDMTLELESPKWKLERGKNYPVKISAGSLSLDAEVAAEPQSVSLDFDNKKLESALRNASTLNIVAAGATIGVPLDKSAVAFDALGMAIATAVMGKPDDDTGDRVDALELDPAPGVAVEGVPGSAFDRLDVEDRDDGREVRHVRLD